MLRRLLLAGPDSESLADELGAYLNEESGFQLKPLNWTTQSLARPPAYPADAILAVVLGPTALGGGFLDWLRQRPATIPAIAVVAEAPDKDVLHQASNAVDDVTVLPIRDWELRYRIGSLLGSSCGSIDETRQQLSQEAGVSQLVGADPRFVDTLRQLPPIAARDAPVLITGETGTGKEICARAVHHLSPRRNGPFITVDCAALPEHLLENELFGHTRGAFTDAAQPQKGQVSLGDGGTVFLDEIDALSLTAQGRLLRLVQERTFRPLGAERVVHVNIRIIAATNRDLESCVREQRFRADLYYRLNVLGLQMPPLRERPGDIVPLARHFLAASSSSEQHRQSFSSGAIRALSLHHWPGNVRELLNVVQRAAALCHGTRILSSHLALPVPLPVRPGHLSPGSRAAVRAAFEHRYLEGLMHMHRGNVTRAAKAAGMERRNLGRLLQKYGISRPRDRD